MRKIILSFFILATYCLANELSLGSYMPETDHELYDISGSKLTLNDIKGSSGTLVIFSCNTCPWVIRWEDRYVSIAEKYVPKGIGMIAVNSNSARFKGDDSMKKMVKHAKDNGYNFPYAQDPDSKLAKAFGARKTPHVYLFDGKNRLVYTGAIDDNARNAELVDENFLANAIDQMLNGQLIKKPISKAIGCSIKFP